MVVDRFPQFKACFAPAADVAKAEMFFRSEKNSSWYRVLFGTQGECRTATLPKPGKKLVGTQLLLYAAGTSRQWGEARTREYAVQVVESESQCKSDKPAAPWVPSASVTVFPSLPLGFTVARGGGVPILAVVGGGAGGVELLLAVRYRMRTWLAEQGGGDEHLEYHLFTDSAGLDVLGAYAGLVYALPLIGGALADRYLGMRKAVVFGVSSDKHYAEMLKLLAEAGYPNGFDAGDLWCDAGGIPPYAEAAANHLVDNPNCTVTDLMQFVKGPDFPTGAFIYGREGLQECYETGRGRIVMRARAAVEEKESSGKSQIVVTEIPFQVNKARLVEQIAELVRAKKVSDVSDLRDESDRDGMRIVIELKRDANASVVLNQLYKHTQMQTNFGIIMLALVDRRPQIVNLKEMLAAFIRFRREVVTRRTRYDLARAREREHVLVGLRKAVDQLDLVIRLIRGAESPDAARDALVAQLELTEIQARAILDMRLQRLTQLERYKLVEEHEQTLALIGELEGILASDARLMEIIKDELRAIKEEYGDARRTEIVAAATDLTIEDLLADEEMVVTITRSGYIKRTHIESYRSQRRGGKGVTGMETKEEDIVEDLFVASTHSFLLFFTNLGKVHWLKVHEIPEGGRQAKGKAMVNILSLGDGERVATCVPVRDFAAGGHVLFATRQGKVKKTELEAYSHPRAGGIQAIGLEAGDEVKAVRKTDGQREVMIATKLGMAIRFSEEEVRPMGRGATGVRGIDVDEGDEVIAADVVHEGVTILTVTERGFGKRTPLDEYRLQGGAGKGIIDIKTGGRNGAVVGMLQIREGDDLLVVTTKGKMIRFHAIDVLPRGRNTWGVRIIDLDQDDRVGSIARVETEQAPAEAS